MNSILTLLLVVVGLGLLYAYRSQTPAVQSVPITKAIQDVEAGRVTSVVITGTTATLALSAGPSERTTLPESGDNPLLQAITAYNQAHPDRPVTLRYDASDSTFPVIGSVLLSLLPVLLIGGFFFYMMRTMRSRDD